MKAVWAMCLAWLAMLSHADDLPALPIATGDWPPPYITAVNPGQSLFGATIERTAARMGMRVDWQILSWPLVEKWVVNGRVFAGLPYVKTPERLALYDFSQPLLASHSVLFYRRDNHRVTSANLNALAHLRIAGPSGYWWENVLTQRGATIMHVSDELAAFKILSVDRADVVPQDELVGWYLVNAHLVDLRDQLATMPLPNAPTDTLHLILSRQYPDTDKLRQRFAKALADELRTGSLNAAVNHYTQSATTPP